MNRFQMFKVGRRFAAVLPAIVLATTLAAPVGAATGDYASPKGGQILRNNVGCSGYVQVFSPNGTVTAYPFHLEIQPPALQPATGWSSQWVRWAPMLQRYSGTTWYNYYPSSWSQWAIVYPGQTSPPSSWSTTSIDLETSDIVRNPEFYRIAYVGQWYWSSTLIAQSQMANDSPYPMYNDDYSAGYAGNFTGGWCQFS